MNERRHQRELLGMSQSDAASRAGVSLATWRRWEENPSAVKPQTSSSCARVLDAESQFRLAVAAEDATYTVAWKDCPYLTPRQASAIASSLGWWVDLYLTEWLREPSAEPLHEVSPFDQLDLRIMMLVGENRAWVAKFAERCAAVVAEIEQGILPFDRPGCYADELLMALALGDAQARLEDMPELYEGIPARTQSGDEDDPWTLDDEWDAVSDAFDDRCRWDEWGVPLYREHSLLPAILAERHPFRWFDSGEGTGSGYLADLAGVSRRTPS